MLARLDGWKIFAVISSLFACVVKDTPWIRFSSIPERNQPTHPRLKTWILVLSLNAEPTCAALGPISSPRNASWQHGNKLRRRARNHRYLNLCIEYVIRMCFSCIYSVERLIAKILH